MRMVSVWSCFFYSPLILTSSIKLTLKFLKTLSFTISAKSIISFALALPRFRIKFACLSDTTASPMRAFFNPALSMRAPADRFASGFLKKHPALGIPWGWVFFSFFKELFPFYVKESFVFICKQKRRSQDDCLFRVFYRWIKFKFSVGKCQG